MPTPPEPPDIETRQRMAATVIERNVLRIKAASAEAADLILEGHLIYEADTDILTLTTTGYLLVPSKGNA